METSRKKPTIYDLAGLAGASPSAVSSVLNGTWQKRRISRSLAERVMRIAGEEGYAVNVQASLLRREKSNIVGMIIPKYDNRYFGRIAEEFETMARARGLFPVITCTRRDPELEFEAARELISYQAECLIATGATDPDRIASLCKSAGVQVINLDLPGALAPSVVSDNFTAAQQLTELILHKCDSDPGKGGALHFVGGRLSDHNTAMRLRGFLTAHESRGIAVPEHHILATGYSADRAASALERLGPAHPLGLFVNSTISLEGVIRWRSSLGAAQSRLRFGCFDWDPFGSFLPGNIGMVEQDVPRMLDRVFELMASRTLSSECQTVPCILRKFV